MAVATAAFALIPTSVMSASTGGLEAGVGNVPQGTQTNSAYAASFKNRGVTNVFVTSRQVSCYRPEVPIPFNNGPNDGYTGELPCPRATTGEDIGRQQYPTQFGTSTAAGPMLVTDKSESDIRVDPTNPNHIIGSSKWFTGAEGYNHLLGFYESWDGGITWPVMGHIPGYEGWTDNTDPVGAFDPYGNHYEAILPYQFYYDKGGHKKYEPGNEPNHFVPNEAVSVAVRPRGVTGVRDWITTHAGHPDYVFPHVDPAGVVSTPVVNYASAQGSCCVDIYVDYSSDGGVSWNGPLLAAAGVHTPPLSGAGYANTTFEDGIEETFAVGNHLTRLGPNYPIYLAYESKSSGYGNMLLTASYDQGKTWSHPIQVNDNANPSVDAFQPNLAVGPDGTVSVNFYDRRLACPAARTRAAANAGLALDRSNPNYGGSLPPYGATHYCITSSVQFYAADLAPKGHNVRITQHSWDPQLNSPNRSCPCNPLDTFLGDYFGNEIAGSIDYATFISTYDDGTNPHHYQQQVVAKISLP